MDIRALTKLILKLGGVWLLVSTIGSIPQLIATPTEYVGLGYAAVGLYLVEHRPDLWRRLLVLDRLKPVRHRSSLVGSSTRGLLVSKALELAVE